jgi:hypothetical protein
VARTLAAVDVQDFARHEIEDRVEQNDEWSVQRSHYPTLESIAPLNDNPSSICDPGRLTDPAKPESTVITPQLHHGRGHVMFRSPQINIYSRDLAKAQSFYASLGFRETFRTPPTGTPSHVELQLDGFKLGIATIEAAQQHHGLGLAAKAVGSKSSCGQTTPMRPSSG